MLFLSSQRDLAFSYREVGASRHAPPAGYSVDHNRVRLGYGQECFERAVNALQHWKMFDLGWVQVCWPNTPIEVGATVAVAAYHFGFWSLNACRIIYVVDEHEPVRRYGFAYGTLPNHAERGEERFTVEWHQADDSVWYDLLAFSRPRLLASLGYPVARHLQKRFAQDSKQAMLKAVKAEALLA